MVNQQQPWLEESCGFGVFAVSLERMHLQLPDHMVESGPFIRTEVDKFTPENPRATPPHNGLGNLNGRFIIRRMDPQMKRRPRLHFDEAEDTTASNGEITQSAIT